MSKNLINCNFKSLLCFTDNYIVPIPQIMLQYCPIGLQYLSATIDQLFVFPQKAGVEAGKVNTHISDNIKWFLKYLPLIVILFYNKM